MLDVFQCQCPDRAADGRFRLDVTLADCQRCFTGWYVPRSLVGEVANDVGAVVAQEDFDVGRDA